MLLGLTTALVTVAPVGTVPAHAGSAPIGKDQPGTPQPNGPCPSNRVPREMQVGELKAFIAGHESTHGLAGDPHVYLDSLGIPTVGIGFNLDRPDAAATLAAVGANYADVRAGRADLTQEQITKLFEITVAEATTHVRQLVPGFDRLSNVRKAVLIDMMFNLGPTRLAQFRNMLAALTESDFAAAAREMQNSSWYSQTGNRARQDVDLMQRGFLCDVPEPRFTPPGPPPVAPEIPGMPRPDHPGYTPYDNGIASYQWDVPWGGGGDGSSGGGSAACPTGRVWRVVVVLSDGRVVDQWHFEC